MSTGKRLAKRSILGTRVVAPGDDGRLYPGIIADMKTPEGGSSSTSNTSNHIRYTVRFDENRKIKDFIEMECRIRKVKRNGLYSLLKRKKLSCKLY